MDELTFDEVISRLSKGSNPVEVAGYGRESTHKGYLTWLLNTSHWPEAKEGLIRLVEIVGHDWPDDYAGKAGEWIRTCPDAFYCEYERKVGGGKIDLLVKAKDGRKLLPIELKTDGIVKTDRGIGENQLSRMSVDPSLRIGLVLLLGSSAVRDNAIPEKAERGCFSPLTVDNILAAWKTIDVPKAGRDWLEALQHEQLRLNNAFDLSSEKRKLAYRDHKHRYYALLNSVKKVLHEKYDSVGTWQLYDGGYNTVLNLAGENWKEVAGGNASAYWEFNDCELVLKVRRDGEERITRQWVEETQKNIRNLEFTAQDRGKKTQNQKARAGSTWISVWRWCLPFDTAHNVAERSVDIIRQVQPVVN